MSHIASAPSRRPAVTPAAWLVWAVFGVLLISTLLFVLRYGVNAPYYDEWKDSVPRLADAEPVTLTWLFSPHNEHRIPLPRMLFLSAYTLGGENLRAVMVLNLLCLGAVTALLLFCAARLRRLGGSDSLALTDVLLPLALLNVGHYANLLWGFQIQFVSSACLSLAFLALILLPQEKDAPYPSVRRAAVLSALLILLPFTGSNGLAFVPPLALWLGWRGLAAVRSKGAGEVQTAGKIALAATALALLITGLYFVGVPRLYTERAPLAYIGRVMLQLFSTAPGRGLVPSPGVVAPPSPLALALALLAAGAAGVAASGKRNALLAAVGLAAGAGVTLWLDRSGAWMPLSAREGVALALVPVTVVLPLLAMLARAVRQKTADGTAAWGGAAFLAGGLLLVAGIAQGRAGIGAYAGLAPRYTTLTAPLLALAYLLSLRLDPRGRFGTGLRWWLLGLCLLCLPGNLQMAAQAGHERQALLQGFLKSVASGTPVSALTSTYVPDLYVEPEALGSGLLALKEARIVPYTAIANDPPVRALELSPDKAQRVGMSEAPGGAIVAGPGGGRLTWTLPQPEFVYGIRVRYETTGVAPPPPDAGPRLWLSTSAPGEGNPSSPPPPLTQGVDSARLGQFGLTTPAAPLPEGVGPVSVALFPNRTVSAVHLIVAEGASPFRVTGVTVFVVAPENSFPAQ